MKLPLDAQCLMRGGELLSLSQAIRPHSAIMLVLWAVWCSPREKDLTSLAEMAASGRFVGLGFAAVNVDFLTADKADACIKEFAPTLPSYHEDPDGLLSRYLPAKFVPATTVIAADGEVLYFGRQISSALRTVLNTFQSYESISAPFDESGSQQRQ
jgi:thiol-disulfide isomerase/thioredoxin